MNITRENIDELNAVLKVKIEKDDYAEKVEKQLRDYRKKAAIKGFRPGNAPMGIIKKYYGKSILVDEVNRLVSETLTKHLVDEKVKVLGEPLPSKNVESDIDFENKSDFEFAFDIALEPEYELKITKRDKVPFYTIAVSDEMVQQTIDSHTARNGKTEEADVVIEKDLVKGTFTQLDAEGNPVEDGIVTEDAVFAVDRVEEASIRNLVLGSKKDDVIDFDVKKAFANTIDLASMLRIDRDVANNLEGNFRFTVTSISRHIPAEVNQELFDSVFGEGEVKTIDEYKAKIKQEIADTLVYQSDFRFLIDAKEKFVSKADLKLPDEFLKRWLVAVNENLTVEQIDEDYDSMRDDLAWQLIKNKLIEENDLKVSEEELLAFAKQSTLRQFQQYGLHSLPDEQLETYAKQILTNDDERRKMWDMKADEKVAAFLKENVKLEEKEVTPEEFNQLFIKK